MHITRYKCSADSNWEIKGYKKYIELGIFYFNCGHFLFAYTEKQKQNKKFRD